MRVMASATAVTDAGTSTAAAAAGRVCVLYFVLICM